MMSFVRRNRKFELIALALMCFVFAAPLVGSSIFVRSAIERGELYGCMAKTAIPGTETAKLAKTVAQTSPLNVFLHLTGTLEASELGRTPPHGLSTALHSIVPWLPVWDLVFKIFHPPRAVPPSP